MKPRNRYLYLKAALRCMDLTGNPGQSLCLHVIRPDAVLFFKAKEYRPDPFYLLNRSKFIIFPVQDSCLRGLMRRQGSLQSVTRR